MAACAAGEVMSCDCIQPAREVHNFKFLRHVHTVLVQIIPDKSLPFE